MSKRNGQTVAVPEGYKVTELGSIPVDWVFAHLGDVLDKCSSGATPYRGKPDYYKGDIRWITSGELNYDTIDDTIEHISPEGMDAANLRLHPPGTFLIAITGLEAAGTRGSCGIVGAPSTTNQSCMALYPKSTLTTEFLFHYYVRHGDSLALQYCQGTKQQSYTAKIVKRLPIAFPPDIAEQRAIATALTDTDDLIESLERLIAKKRRIKEGAMGELLSGERRLEGFEGEWEKLPLGEIASIRNQKVMPRRVQRDTLCVELEHVGQGTGSLLEGTTAGVSRSSKYQFAKGDVLFGRLRSYLRKYWYATKDGICSTELWPLVADSSYLLPRYLYAIVQTEDFIESASISYGTHMPRADWSVMREFSVNVPSLHEQHAIATLLTDIDLEIEALEEKLAKVRRVKEGMMGELLGGRVRLV